MSNVRRAIAFQNFGNHRARTLPRHAARVDPRLFGRGQTRVLEPVVERRWTISDDLWLFGTTFAAGFIFVSIFIG